MKIVGFAATRMIGTQSAAGSEQRGPKPERIIVV